ncbi:hypothetical protein H7Y63_04175 [Polaromonas sp.]|nr:hypothetical protein [Candidatus Saccharibacteria bacterium]
MPMYSGMQPFSAQSAADILDPDSYYNTFPYYESLNGQLGTKEIFSAYLNITKPMLIIAGSDDEAASTAGGAEAALHLLKKYTNPIVTAKCAYSIVPEADHSFHGAEDEFAVKVASWLK